MLAIIAMIAMLAMIASACKLNIFPAASWQMHCKRSEYMHCDGKVNAS
jgi:hypothetical protein